MFPLSTVCPLPPNCSVQLSLCCGVLGVVAVENFSTASNRQVSGKMHFSILSGLMLYPEVHTPHCRTADSKVLLANLTFFKKVGYHRNQAHFTAKQACTSVTVKLRQSRLANYSKHKSKQASIDGNSFGKVSHKAKGIINKCYHIAES